MRLDYAEVVDAATLEPVERIEPDTLVAIAAFVGRARLIDNVTIVPDRTGCPRSTSDCSPARHRQCRRRL